MRLLFCLLYACLSTTPVLRPRKTFKAATFEYAKNENPVTGIETNLKELEKVAENAGHHNADILVFGEIAIIPIPITGNWTAYRIHAETIPDPRQTEVNPCDLNSADHPILTRLSCMAKNNKIYLVANIADRQPCTSGTPCRDDGINVYNTDVAFDRQGKLVARYHKRYLHGEDYHDRAPEPNLIYFDTEFGRFGLIVCFDTVFSEAIQLIEKHNVDTIIIPTWWTDVLPAHAATEMFSSFSVANRVNVIASNIQMPLFGTLGSGLFSPIHGAINYTNIPNFESKLIMGTLSSDPLDPEVKLTIDESPRDVNLPYTTLVTDMSNFTTLPLAGNEADMEICQEGLCCKLRYKTSTTPEGYFFSVHKGIQVEMQKYMLYDEFCTVYKCQKAKGTLCTVIPTETDTVFEVFQMSGNFTTKYVYPSFSGNDLELLSHKNWTYNRDHHGVAVQYNSRKPLLLANLYGRVYDKDPAYNP